MKSWTPDASQHFESWLGRVRTSVAGDPTIDADDVAQDLRAHVHAELEAAPEPVTVGALQSVLDSLGTPAQWSVTDKAHPKQRLRDRLERDVAAVVRDVQKALAGEWGVPVLLAIVTLIGIMTFDEGIGVVILGFTYFFSRSQVTYAAQPIMGRRKWVVYFPLAIGSGVLVGLVLGFPLTFRGFVMGPYSSQFETLWVLGSWWMLVGLLASREPGRVRTALKPFADGFDATHGRMLMLLGAAFLIASSVVILAD